MKPIDTKNIKTSAQVLAELKALKHHLETSRLSNLGPFNLAYVIVTQTIAWALKSDYFTDAAQTEAFTVQFAHYYFRAINSMLAGDPKTPQPWSEIIRPTPLSPGITLLMGANAHINHDLPLALSTAHIDENTGLMSDLVKIDRLLMKSGREILPHVSKGRLRWLYYLPVMYLIRYWRIRAVYDARILKMSTSATRHVIRSTRVATRLLHILNLKL